MIKAAVLRVKFIGRPPVNASVRCRKGPVRAQPTRFEKRSPGVRVPGLRGPGLSSPVGANFFSNGTRLKFKRDQDVKALPGNAIPDAVYSMR